MQSLAIRLLSSLFFAINASAIFGDDVDVVLKRWSDYVAAHPGNGFHGTAKLFNYDSLFQLETRRQVEFWTDGMNRWQIDYLPVAAAGKQSRMTAKDGSFYRLQSPGRCERWTRDGASLIQKVGLRDEAPAIHRLELTMSRAPEPRSLLDQIADWPTICAEGLALPLHLCRSGLATVGSRDTRLRTTGWSNLAP